MLDLFHLFLYLHIAAAIVAFGPTFAFAVGGAMAAREPQHANFMTRVNHVISDRIVLPLALSMAVTGVLMVWQIPAFGSEWWLGLAIVLYVVALATTLFYIRPAVNRMIALTSVAPGPDVPPPPPRRVRGARRQSLAPWSAGRRPAAC